MYHNALKPDAFDSSTYGISGVANKLMRSYLENRHQRISVKDSKPNKVFSKWVYVKHGVHRVWYWVHYCFLYT